MISSEHLVFVRPFVKRSALCYRTVVLSVTLVYCGQTVGWIKMNLGVQVGLCPSHTVLDELPHGKGLSRHPTFEICVRRLCLRPYNPRPCLLWPNGWMDQDET